MRNHPSRTEGIKKVIDKEIVKAITVYGAAVTDHATQHGIVTAITSTQISNIVFFGITLGGWATILILLGTLFIFIMNLSKFTRFVIHRYREFKLWRDKRKQSKL